MAEITATLRDNQGNAKVGWTVQFRLASTSAVVSTTANGTVTDHGNGTYSTNNAPTGGTYDVFACAAGGTPALVKGYNDIRHLVFPLAEPFGGTSFTSLQSLLAELSIEPGVDIQDYSDYLDDIVDNCVAFNALNTDGILAYDQANDQVGLATVAATRTLLGLTDSNATRELLGVEIGADVQAYSSHLTTLAADIAGVASFPAFLAVTDPGAGVDRTTAYSATNFRTALGLGTSAVLDTTITGAVDKVVKVGHEGYVTIPTDDGSHTAIAANLGKLFIRHTGTPTTPGTFGVYICVITGVYGPNYTYGLEPLYDSSWIGA